MWLKRNMFLAPEGDVGVPSLGTTTPAPPAAAPVAPAEPAPSEVITTKGGKPVHLTQNTIDKIKREQYARGQKAAQKAAEETQTKLRAAEEELAKLRARNRPPKNQPKPGQQTNAQRTAPNPARQNRRDEREVRESNERLMRERRERIKAQNRMRQIEQEKWAAEANGELRVIAFQAGITDPDYAITLLNREGEAKQNSLPPDQYQKWLAELDERKFFDDLRNERPHLFAEVRKPATTGTTPTTAPPPGAAAVTTHLSTGVREDVKKESTAAFNARLNRMGLRQTQL